MQYQIYWQPQTKLHELQGAVVDFVKENEVRYQNHFLPSGQPIASCFSDKNYFYERQMATLPELVEGKAYHTVLRSENSKTMHAYLAWVFFDQSGQTIKTLYQNGPEMTLTVPRGTHSYRLDLLSAGSGAFTFQEITIAPKVDGILVDGDQAVTEHLMAYLDMPETLASKTLRVILTEPELDRINYPVNAVQPSPQAVLYLATDLVHCQSYYDEKVLGIINQSKKQAKAKYVEFVGYGPISALTALLYRRAVKNATAVLPEGKNLELPAGHRTLSYGLQAFLDDVPGKVEELRSADDEVLVNKVLADNPSPLKAPETRADLLSSLTYLDWPLSKKEEKARAKEAKRAVKAAEKEVDEQAVIDQSEYETNDDATVFERRKHMKEIRKQQAQKLVDKKQHTGSSQQRLQEFFVKNRH
ncbi:accessory Sec system protein Asp3 [Fructobacillus sp. M2-14]|uniref:Accessory Sec system protein Asp3 n=1 Tax=Fructobacillus broussonetiae TaxID=2713173 RepID=A0ABS5QZ46_9LACO|nr:accessory Sec system protein Asp3 [Fructobacillus broussonetiae]MBS9338464.1 accessory Sec system protein Asp3 [Fructobacillus broussonetiae]